MKFNCYYFKMLFVGIIVILLFFNTPISAQEYNTGVGFKLGIGYGNSYRNRFNDTYYDCGNYIMYNFVVHFIPKNAKKIELGIIFRKGYIWFSSPAGKDSDDDAMMSNMVGLNFITRPLNKIQTRFQPYLGVELVGTNVSSFAINPSVGLDIFTGRRFSFNLGYTYIMYINPFSKVSNNTGSFFKSNNIFSLNIKLWGVF